MVHLLHNPKHFGPIRPRVTGAGRWAPSAANIAPSGPLAPKGYVVFWQRLCPCGGPEDLKEGLRRALSALGRPATSPKEQGP